MHVCLIIGRINIHSRFCSSRCKTMYSGVTGTGPGLSAHAHRGKALIIRDYHGVLRIGPDTILDRPEKPIYGGTQKQNDPHPPHYVSDRPD
jgi:hypothetical protein